jgi:hypothetical protein
MGTSLDELTTLGAPSEWTWLRSAAFRSDSSISMNFSASMAVPYGLVAIQS